MMGPGAPPGPSPTPSPTLAPGPDRRSGTVIAVCWTVRGRTFPFTAVDVVGFHPVTGLSALAELGTDGSLLRLTLPGHPVRPEPGPGRPFGWATVLAAAELEGSSARWQEAFGPGLPAGARLTARALPEGGTLVEIRWPEAHLLLRERRTLGPRRRWNGGSSPAAMRCPPVLWELLPAGVFPAEERRLLGPEATDPWAARPGVSRLLVRVLRAALLAAARHLVLEHAGRLLLGADEALGRLGDPDDAERAAVRGVHRLGARSGP